MFTFPKSSRLLRRYQFKMLSRAGKPVVGRYIIMEKMYMESNKAFGPKLGITVSRQFGKAVLRNRFKRAIRESFRHASTQLPTELYINIRPRSHAAQASSENIRQELFEFLNPLIVNYTNSEK